MNAANGANGHSIHMSSNNNNVHQFNKSLDDWLNSNCNNMNNNGLGITSTGAGISTAAAAAAAAIGATTITNNDTNRSSHLDDWLNATTMKDSPKTFSVSSTEFLDGPSRNVINSNGLNTTGIVMPPINLLRMMPDYQVNNGFRDDILWCFCIWC